MIKVLCTKNTHHSHVAKWCAVTHRSAADHDQEEGLPHTCNAHNPAQTQEQDHAQDVLECGQVHAHDGPQVDLRCETRDADSSSKFRVRYN